MDHTQNQNFEFTLPKHLHDQAMDALKSAPGLDHVEQQPTPGKIRIKSLKDDGVVLELSPVSDTDRVIVQVVENPQNIPLSKIEAEFRADVKHFAQALENPGAAASQTEPPPMPPAAPEPEPQKDES